MFRVIPTIGILLGVLINETNDYICLSIIHHIIMKTKGFLFFVALLFCASIYAQNNNNFSLTPEGKVYWQRVYNIDLTHDDLLDIIINDGNFVDITDGEVITFRVVRGKIDFGKYGFSRGRVPIYVAASDVSCFVTLQMKDGKYRVTADNIVLTENVSGGLLKEGTENTLETYAVRRGDLSNGFLKAPSELYNAYFSTIFFFQKKSYLDDEW